MMANTANAETKPSGATKFNALFPTMEVSPFAEFNSRNLTTATRAGAAMMKGAAAYWSRVGVFMGKRMQCDIDAVQSLSACRSGEDAARTQHEFVSRMIDEYSNEMHELLSISADIARGVAEPIEARAEEAIHSMEARNARAPAAAE